MSNFSINVFRGSYYTPLFYIALFLFSSVTLDLKALYMLIVKLGDETFVLGGRGIDIEFCFLCHALRVFILIFEEQISKGNLY